MHMQDTTAAREVSAQHFWGLMQALGAAKREGDQQLIWEALDELDVFTLHAAPSTARALAAREVARHRFHKARQSPA
jgi:hypothetical protein